MTTRNMTHDAAADNVKGITAFALKIVALVLTIVGTISTAVLLPGIGELRDADTEQLTVVVVADAVSWCAVPLYAWLLTNGFRHTRSAVCYLGRLVLLAVISEVPYDMATSGTVWDMGSQNPVWGLCVALVVLIVFRALRGRNDLTMWVVRVAVTLAALMWVLLLNMGLRLGLVNEGLMSLVFVMLFYLMSKRENAMMLTAGAFGACMFVLPVLGVMLLHWRTDRQGYPASWVKWLFYVLYPTQLLLFGLVAVL